MSGYSMPTTPELVATDLDGTLLRGDGSIAERSRRALALVTDTGARLVFATGRPPRWLRGLEEMTGHRGMAVCSNGALVYDLATSTVVEQNLLAPEVGLAVLEAIRDGIDGVSFAVERGDLLLREPDYPVPELELAVDDPQSFVVEATEELLAGPLVKLLARHGTRDADTLLDQARAVVGEVAELTHSNGRGLIEIAAPGVSKASTLASLCATWEIAPGNVVAFGDMPNDLPMLAWAGTSYAVENAHPEVLDLVDRRCPANDDDGVARVLERLFG